MTNPITLIGLYFKFNKAIKETKENMNTSKPWYKSLTIWSNLILAVLGAVPDVTAKVSANPAAAATIAAVVNILLRFKTDSGVTVSADK